MNMNKTFACKKVTRIYMYVKQKQNAISQMFWDIATECYDVGFFHKFNDLF